MIVALRGCEGPAIGIRARWPRDGIGSRRDAGMRKPPPFRAGVSDGAGSV
ncbi:hypothetical protein SEA_FROGHOPPER_80 [Mycobacterium phage Froghopper]|nr:hypothetical protein SEA_FROGHOPPER_80 [Mycobacterium phage Froghopper]